MAVIPRVDVIMVMGFARLSVGTVMLMVTVMLMAMTMTMTAVND